MNPGEAYSALLRSASRAMVIDHRGRGLWNKGLSMGTGQANVKVYNQQLCRLIQLDRAQPAVIVSHECSLEETPEACEHFDKHDDGWTKVVLKTGMSAGGKAISKAGAVANTGAKGSQAAKSHAHAHAAGGK